MTSETAQQNFLPTILSFWFICYILQNSSIPSQYVDNNSMQHDASGDVVIVVPSIDNDDKTSSILVSRMPHEHSVCIDPEEADMMEPNSPKTITESSSKYQRFQFYV